MIFYASLILVSKLEAQKIRFTQTNIHWSPKGATSFPDRGLYEYDQIRLACIYGVYCIYCEMAY